MQSPPSSPPCCRIALPVPLRRLFDYLPPSSGPLPQPGQRVRVPFGKQQLIGIMVEFSTGDALPPEKLKTIEQVLDQQEVVPENLLGLVRWSADYYQHPFGDALLSVLPAQLREGQPASLPRENAWRLTVHGKGLPAGALQRSPQQAELLRVLQSNECSSTQLKAAGISAAVIRALHDKGLIESFERDPAPPVPAPLLSPGKNNLQLNSEQQHAVKEISQASGFQTFLLQGVTGSGKTEVYLQAIEQVLRQNRQALVLVPEIGLTPQTVERFRARFNQSIVTLHSGLNDRERCHHWLRAASGEAAIVIGTRSAVFTPMPRLGILVVDEEHDASFKQQDGFRYHARDVAIVRGQRENIPVILGSATPSLESLRNAELGRYRLLTLATRAGTAQTPRLHLLDVSREKLQNGFSPLLLEMMRHTLQQGQQVLIFLNRRGYAPVLICADCGWMANCPHCDARLTAHKTHHGMRCHHCGWQTGIPRQCPTCQSRRLDVLGFGTQRSEEALQKLFPDMRILRIDRDSTSRKHAMAGFLSEIHDGRPAILVGTQMLAKGHHFPDVTLVGILDADSGMFNADFRSAEKLAQLLTQVSGRAGRADKPGQVVLQSAFCEHPLMQQLARLDYPAIARELLQERQRLGLPPFQAQAVLRSEATHRDAAEQFLKHARALAETHLTAECPIHLLGPLPALMEKRANRYRQELVFSSPNRPRLQALLAQLATELEADPEGKKVRWAVDVDPV